MLVDFSARCIRLANFLAAFFDSSIDFAPTITNFPVEKHKQVVRGLRILKIAAINLDGLYSMLMALRARSDRLIFVPSFAVETTF